MRQIIFRGKRADNGELVISDSLMQVKGQYPRLWVESDVNGWVEVLPETVGQFTGLKDKNGKKIFEGDIIRYRGSIGRIVFAELHGSFMSIEDKIYYEWLSNLPYYGTYGTEVIGNIYDNPELI